MADQRNHKYELQFGQPISFYTGSPDTLLPNQIPVSTINPLIDVNYYLKSIEGKSILLSNHHLYFRIKKSKDVGQESTMTLYNISDDTRGFLDKFIGEDPYILFSAGYETDSEIPIIFQGNIIDINEKFEGPTRITDLTLRSGATSIKEAFTTKSYRSGIAKSDVLKSLILDLRLPEGTLLFKNDGEVTNKNLILHGSTIDILNKYSRENGYHTWIEDGTVNVVPRNYASVITADRVLNISPALRNMIGSPTISSTETSTKENQNGVRKYIKVKTTLNGTIKLGNRVNIDSKFHQGIYTVEGLEHVGSYEGSEWYTELELAPLDGWEVKNDSQD